MEYSNKASRQARGLGSQAASYAGCKWRVCFEEAKRVNVEHDNLLVLGGTAIKPTDARSTRKVPAQELPADAETQVRIRPYQKSDRETIYRLCYETGYLGRVADPLFQDRDLFADLFTRPYLDYEQEWAIVAEERKQVVGYLLGSVRPRFDLILMQCGLRTTAKMLLRLAAGRYKGHPRSRRFIRWLLTTGFWEQPRHPHPASHLHLQVDQKHRGGNVARRLWESYEGRIREIGINQCYGAFFSRPERRPELAYSRFGFRVFDRRRTTLFEPEVSEPVEVVCVSKRF
jgi:GNAT superfamily N-acetyltransferase